MIIRIYDLIRCLNLILFFRKMNCLMFIYDIIRLLLSKSQHDEALVCRSKRVADDYLKKITQVSL